MDIGRNRCFRKGGMGHFQRTFRDRASPNALQLA